MTEPLYMGIDAGGSRTVCLVGDRHETLGRGEAGPANPSHAGVAGFRAAISAAAAEALGRRPRATALDAAWIGVAGSEAPAVRAALRVAAEEALDVRRVHISHDARLILAAAGLVSGIAVVAGTGSAVYGRSSDGREVKIGGWGHLLGDEGSAYDIARRALRAVTQAADGRAPATRLSEAVPSAAGARSVDELRERFYPAPPVDQVAQLARVVLELAGDDEAASAIVSDAARELAHAVRTCRRRLVAADGEHSVDGSDMPVVAAADAMPVVLAGGLLGEGSALLARLVGELQPDGAYRVIRLTVEPAAGALALARDGPAADQPAGGWPEAEEEKGWQSDEQIHQQPKESLR